MEATAFGQSIFAYAPKSRGVFDYMNFAKELIKYSR
jgi:cellulose biosynthesis protein BcsQ